MLNGIHHVAVAVPALEAALPIYRDLLGFDLEAVETVPDQGVRVAVLTRAGDRMELLEPLAEDSPVARFLEKRGPGLHHVCLDVRDLDGLLERMRGAGIRLIDEEPRVGAQGRRIAFVHPASTGGVLIELSEAPAE